jgi:membrane-bound metal-dependent hydrolase YbcI (DUF457 family)
MRYAYFLIALAIVIAGVYAIVDDLRGDEFLRGLGVLAGLCVVFLGVLNLLNCVYGLTARGIRASAFGANIAMLAFGFWFAGRPAGSLEWVVFALVLVCGCLSLTPRALGPLLPWVKTKPVV